MYEEFSKYIPVIARADRVEFYEPGPDENSLGKFVSALEGEDARDYVRRQLCSQATGAVIAPVAAYHGLTFYPHIGKVQPGMVLNWQRAHADDICNSWPKVVPVEPDDPRKVGWAAIYPAGDGWGRKTPIRFTQEEVERDLANLVELPVLNKEARPL
jgi:hypothetical protein